MIWVYVIQSKLDNGYYIGITKDIQNRLKKHNKGGVSITEKEKAIFSRLYRRV